MDVGRQGVGVAGTAPVRRTPPGEDGEDEGDRGEQQAEQGEDEHGSDLRAYVGRPAPDRPLNWPLN